MNWIDVSLIVLWFIILWAGTYRGLIMEIFDIITILGGFITATHLYNYGAIFLKIVFKKIPIQTASAISFLTFFVIAGIIITLLGTALELANKIPIAGGINKFFGGVFASIKGIVLLWATVILVNLAPLNEAIRNALKSSPSVKVLTWGNPIIDLVFKFTTSKEAYNIIHSVISKANF